jgi:type I restriction-modification system DNA methylase subunit
MLKHILQLNKEIKQASTYSKDKSDKHGEVFTPGKLIQEMIDKLPKDIWRDPSKTFFDPCAGKGNFPIYIIARLFLSLKNSIPDEKKRLQHIVENQMFMAEFQRESAEFINKAFKFGFDFKVNLYHGDTLSMPSDFFELSYKERQVKYPEFLVD